MKIQMPILSYLCICEHPTVCVLLNENIANWLYIFYLNVNLQECYSWLSNKVNANTLYGLVTFILITCQQIRNKTTPSLGHIKCTYILEINSI